jgi:ureidoglycolate hydrolase
MDGLEIFSYEGKGYKPLVDFESWRVAILNDIPKYERGNITYLEKHIETDEVFILLKGSCELILAGSGETPGEIERVVMQPERIYNVKKETWHSCMLLPGTTLVIVENSKTSEKNSIKFNLSASI